MKKTFKKVLLTIVAVCCMISIYGQDSLHKKTILSPIIEITGGANFPLYNQSAKQSLGIGRKLQYAVGLHVGLDFARPKGIFSLMTGAIFNSNDFSSDSQYTPDWNLKTVFVNIPFIVSYHYHVGKAFYLSFSGGYEIKQLIKDKLSYTIPGFEITNRTMHGIYVAAGFTYRASPHFSLRVEPVFEYFWWKYKRNLSKEFHYEILDCMSSPMIGLRFTLKGNILKEFN